MLYYLIQMLSFILAYSILLLRASDMSLKCHSRMSEVHLLSKYVLTDHPLHSRDSDGTKETTRNQKRRPLLSQGLQFSGRVLQQMKLSPKHSTGYTTAVVIVSKCQNTDVTVEIAICLLVNWLQIRI